MHQSAVATALLQQRVVGAEYDQAPGWPLTRCFASGQIGPAVDAPHWRSPYWVAGRTTTSRLTAHRTLVPSPAAGRGAHMNMKYVALGS
jgi:hypothetical protein